jgi:hypothetical protein
LIQAEEVGDGSAEPPEHILHGNIVPTLSDSALYTRYCEVRVRHPQKENVDLISPLLKRLEQIDI